MINIRGRNNTPKGGTKLNGISAYVGRDRYSVNPIGLTYETPMEAHSEISSEHLIPYRLQNAERREGGVGGVKEFSKVIATKGRLPRKEGRVT